MPSGILDPGFHEYVSAFIDSSAAPAAAAAPPPQEDEEAGSKVWGELGSWGGRPLYCSAAARVLGLTGRRAPASRAARPPAPVLPQVCLQRNLPPLDKLAASADSAYDGVQMVNGLECKLCNMQQKIKRWGRAGGVGPVEPWPCGKMHAGANGWVLPTRSHLCLTLASSLPPL